jgi:hypothetical protein
MPIEQWKRQPESLVGDSVSSLVAASCTQYKFPSKEDDDDDDKPWNATKDDN